MAEQAQGVSLADIQAARERIAGLAHVTPIHTSRQLNEWAGCSVFLKCENLQRVGAFKFRGATNAVLQLTDKQVARGVVTHSSGNHAQALALAAKQRGTKAWIVMPENAPSIKRRAVEGYGAEVVTCAPTVAAREQTAVDVATRTGATFIHPYDNDAIIAGQGTIGLELIDQLNASDNDLDAVVVPVGGGGLCSGVSTSIRALAPETAVWGVEPTGADDASRSLKSSRIVPVTELPGGAAQTICDGLRTSLCDRTFAILRKNLDGILTVDDDVVVEAMRFLWERMKLVVEPSGAVGVAALITHRQRFEGKHVAIVLSGGNIAYPS